MHKILKKNKDNKSWKELKKFKRFKPSRGMEQGAGSREQRARSREQRAGSRKQHRYYSPFEGGRGMSSRCCRMPGACTTFMTFYEKEPD
jgi:hypothetical protein